MKTLTEELVAQLDEELKLGLARDLHRSGFAVGIEPQEATGGATKTGVDKNERIIYGVAVATEGPALGHDMHLDQAFLDQLVTAGNHARQGIKARFDHPNASSTSMGKAIGRFKAFRKTGAIVRADLHLLKSAERAPEGNYPDYLMELATEDPQSFGTSIVFAGKPAIVLNEDGTRKTDEQGNPLPRLARLEKLYAADVVDEPAANPGGLFHAMAEGSLAAKIASFLDRYFQHKGLGMTPPPASPKENDMPKETAQAIAATDPTDLLKAEKARMFSILKYGRKLGVPDGQLEALMEKDEPLEQILMGLIDDAETRHFFHQKTALSLIETGPNPSAGGPSDPGVTTTEKKPATKALAAMTAAEKEAHWKAEFQADVALQAMFLEEGLYVAFKQNESRTRSLTGRAEQTS